MTTTNILFMNVTLYRLVVFAWTSHDDVVHVFICRVPLISISCLHLKLSSYVMYGNIPQPDTLKTDNAK